MSPERKFQPPSLQITRQYKYGRFPKNWIAIQWQTKLSPKQMVEKINAHILAQHEKTPNKPFILNQNNVGSFPSFSLDPSLVEDGTVTLHIKPTSTGTQVFIEVSHGLWSTNKQAVVTLSNLVQFLFG